MPIIGTEIVGVSVKALCGYVMYCITNRPYHNVQQQCDDNEPIHCIMSNVRRSSTKRNIKACARALPQQVMHQDHVRVVHFF
jgi:hypothetical protein